MRILDFEFRRELANCSIAAGMWNYFDAEHVGVIHGSGYEDDKILHDDDRMRVDLLVVRPPVFRFLKTFSWAIHQKHAENAFSNYTTMFGVPVLTTLSITEPEPEKIVSRSRYVFFLTGWRVLLAPVLKWLMPIWADKIWTEDLPLKLRRHRALKSGFKDFNGLPDRISDRYASGPMKVPNRVPRLPGCPIDDKPVEYGFKTDGDKITGQVLETAFSEHVVKPRSNRKPGPVNLQAQAGE